MRRHIAMIAGAAMLLASTGALASGPPPDPGRDAGAALSRLHRLGALMSLRLLGELHEARRTGDFRRVRCLDGTVTEVHAALRQVSHRLDGLGGEGRQEATVLRAVAILEARFRDLAREARACQTGEREAQIPMGPSGVTRVEMTVAPGTPDEDPTRLARP